ncbi:MAG: hypothetical protein H7289_06730 [Mucilaginibacter sp.]|nr:hypothetical protein [Mucilaginibacter sp.]
MPYNFLLDYLPRTVVIKQNFGMYYIYWEGKIVLILREQPKNSHHNGIWISTTRKDHASLKADIPAITDFVFNEGEVFDTAWLLLRPHHDDFETAAISICELIAHRDKRIGKATKKAVELSRL